MKQLSTIPVLFNIGGVLVILTIAGYTLHTAFDANEIASCSQRYPSPMRISLRNSDNELLSSEEFEANVGQSGPTLLSNAIVQDVPSGPTTTAIKVSMISGTGSHYQSEVEPGGMSFQWRPYGIGDAQSACLKYGVWLAPEFDFSVGGILPGLFGGQAPELNAATSAEAAEQTPPGIAARIMWQPSGGGVFIQAQQSEEASASRSNRGRPAMWQNFTLPTGKWVVIEQELVLNTPGKEDGVLRLWADGKLRLETTRLAWRHDESLALSGVIADVAYGSPRSGGVAPKSTTVQLSPFDVSWQ